MDIWKAIGGNEQGGRWVGHDPCEQFPVYTRGNAGEVYPEVFTPLSFSVAAVPGEQAMRNALLNSGLVLSDELVDMPITTAVGTGVFGGYAYLNLSVLRLASARTPGGKPTDADVNFLGVGDPPPHEPLPGERNLRATLGGLRYVWRTVNTTDIPALAADQRQVAGYLKTMPDIEDAGDSELWAAVKDMMPLFGDLFERHLKISFSAGTLFTVLSSLCERQLDDPMLAVTLLAGLGDVDSAAPSQAIWNLSRLVNDDSTLSAEFDTGVDGLWERLRNRGEDDGFVSAFLSFLDEFGSRGPNEWDTAFDTWETRPELALTMVDRMRGADDSHNPALQQARLSATAAAAETAAVAEMPRPLRGLFKKVLASARLHSRSRERSKTTVIKAIHGARLRAMELDRRLVERSGGQRGDLWFIVDDEAEAYLVDPGAFAKVIAERREQHRLLDERVPPFFFAGQQPPLDEWELKTAGRDALPVGETLTGLPGCPGKAKGRARIVTDPADPRGLEPGDVLIAPLTDPAWTPLFVPAEAVVVDVGAIMSHAVIVSRELGIPCVISAADATKRIPDGALVEVDGAAGTVTLLEGPADAERA